MSAKDRILEVMADLNLKAPTFAKNLGFKNQRIYDILKGQTSNVSAEVAAAIQRVYPEYNLTWLMLGEGEKMQEYQGNMVAGGRKNLIPFYDDVATIGGADKVANMDGVSAPSEYIDTGDWFREATAAIRHYGDSMQEYPSGCILALKEVRNRELIVPGRDYCIETSEYRVTKRIQLGKSDETFTAYSSNTETYPDGRLVHEPFEIPKSEITRMSLVLGYVVKKNGGTMVFSRK